MIENNIKSVQRQKYDNFEHIFVDNISSDNTLNIIKNMYSNSSNFLIKSENDKGISDAFNKGMKLCSGDIIGFLNSDDEYSGEDSLQRIADAFNNPEVNFVHGNMIFNDDLYGTNNRSPLITQDNTVEHGMPFNFPTMYFRSTYLTSLPEFKNELRYAMDLDLICSMYKKDKFKNSIYLGTKPIVLMNAGGVSDAYEFKAHDEAINILKSHELWTNTSAKSFRKRKFRLVLKKMINKLNLNFLIKIWRGYKWKT